MRFTVADTSGKITWWWVNRVLCSITNTFVVPQVDGQNVGRLALGWWMLRNKRKGGKIIIIINVSKASPSWNAIEQTAYRIDFPNLEQPSNFIPSLLAKIFQNTKATVYLYAVFGWAQKSFWITHIEICIVYLCVMYTGGEQSETANGLTKYENKQWNLHPGVRCSRTRTGDDLSSNNNGKPRIITRLLNWYLRGFDEVCTEHVEVTKNNAVRRWGFADEP